VRTRRTIASLAALAALTATGLLATVATGDGPGVPGPGPAPAEGRIEPDAARPSTPARLGNARARTEPTAYYVVRGSGEEARRRSLRERAARRAYEGAPPPTPHSGVFGRGVKTCLDCHLEGMTLGSRVARPMSHAPLTQCTQCHVEAAHRMLGAAEPLASNAFEGAGSRGPGARASEDAPPAMPHTPFMRGRCLSCHGEHGYPGLQTDHPRRAQCVQCHVPRAGRDPRAPVFGER